MSTCNCSSAEEFIPFTRKASIRRSCIWLCIICEHNIVRKFRRNMDSEVINCQKSYACMDTLKHLLYIEVAGL